MKVFALALLGGALVLAIGANSAPAHSPFKKAFEERYVKNGGDAIQTAFDKAGCNVCHVKDEKKEVRNAFGQALHKELMAGELKGILKAKDEKEYVELMKKFVTEEKATALKALNAAFDKVEKMPAAGGKTYAELFKEGKLP